MVALGAIACGRCKQPFVPVVASKGPLAGLVKRECDDCDPPRSGGLVSLEKARPCTTCKRPFVPKRGSSRLCRDCTSGRGRKTYEAAQQKAFVAHVRRRGDMPVAASNGAHLANGPAAWNGLRAMGAAKGFPDVAVHGPVGKPSLFVEMKSPGGKMSAEQEDWRDHLLELGHAHFVAYSALEAIEAYEAWRKKLRG